MHWETRFLHNTRVADGDGAGRDRLDHNASGANNRVVADVFHYHGTVADPGVASDAHLAEFLGLIANRRARIVEAVGVPAGQDVNIAADERVITNAAHSQNTAAADIDARADAHVAMGNPRAELNRAVPCKRVEAHPIEAAAEEDSEKARKEAQDLRTSEKKPVRPAESREESDGKP